MSSVASGLPLVFLKSHFLPKEVHFNIVSLVSVSSFEFFAVDVPWFFSGSGKN